MGFQGEGPCWGQSNAPPQRWLWGGLAGWQRPRQPGPGIHWGLGSNHPQDFSYDEPKVEFDVDAPSGVVMEGYLFKRASNAFKTWNR